MRKCTFYTSACSDRAGEKKIYRQLHENTQLPVTPTGDFPIMHAKSRLFIYAKV